LADAAGRGVIYAVANRRYCAIWPDAALLRVLIDRMAGEAGVDLLDLPESIRVRRSASHAFTFNYAAQPVLVPHLGETRAPVSCHIASL
jgi:beta-galactosidase